MTISRMSPANSVEENTITSNRGSRMMFSIFETLDQSNGPSYLWDGTCGLDKTRITIPFNQQDVDMRELRFNLFGSFEYKGQLTFSDFPDLFISTYGSSFGAAQVEFNPSDFTKPFGLNLCPFELAPHVIKLVIQQLVRSSEYRLIPVFYPPGQLFLSPEHYPSDWSKTIDYSRIELTRDFLIGDPKFSLEQMKYFRPKRAKAVTLQINGKQLNTISHPAAPGSAKMSVYDKTAEANRTGKHAYQKNTFRFEVKLPRGQIKLNGLGTVHRAVPQYMHETLMKFWTKSNYHSPLLYEGDLVEKLIGEYGPIDGGMLLGYQYACLTGFRKTYSDDEQKYFDKLLKLHAVKTTEPISQQGCPYGRLDLPSGNIDYSPIH